MSDLLNPDLEILRSYMNDPTMQPGIEQDWEIVITGDHTAEHLVALSLENTVRHGEVVDLLYLYTESVLRNWIVSTEEKLHERLRDIPPHAPQDVLKWKSETERALSDPIIVNTNPRDFDVYFFAEYFGHGNIF